MRQTEHLQHITTRVLLLLEISDKVAQAVKQNRGHMFGTSWILEEAIPIRFKAITTSKLTFETSFQRHFESVFSRRRINTLIKACANAGNLTRAEYWLGYLQEMNVQQNPKGLGKMLEARCTSELMSKAPTVLD